MTSVGNHQVGNFEIPADNVENLKNFYSSCLAGSLREERHKAIT